MGIACTTNFVCKQLQLFLTYITPITSLDEALWLRYNRYLVKVPYWGLTDWPVVGLLQLSLIAI